MADQLKTECGISPEDVMISITENGFASFETEPGIFNDKLMRPMLVNDLITVRYRDVKTIRGNKICHYFVLTLLKAGMTQH
jgi:hypothetical protein